MSTFATGKMALSGPSGLMIRPSFNLRGKSFANHVENLSVSFVLYVASHVILLFRMMLRNSFKNVNAFN